MTDEPVRYYLAGPMAGLPDHGFPVFDAAAKDLRGRGFDIFSPHETDHGESPDLRGKSKPRGAYLKDDILALLSCDGVVLLPGWETSRGARIEVQVAKACDYDIFLYVAPDEQLIPVQYPTKGEYNA